MAEPERKLNPPPPLSTPKEAPWTDVQTIIAALQNLSSQVHNLVVVLWTTMGLPGVPGEPGEPGAPGAPGATALFPLLQRDKWAHDHVYVTTPGTAVQLPSLAIPPGFDLVIRAFTTNTGNVYIGNAKASASLDTKRVTLSAGEAAKLKISDSSLVHVDAAVPDEGIEFFVEV